MTTLTDDLEKRSADALKTGTVIKGRQIYWLVNSHFKTNPSLSLVHGITDLNVLSWLGGGNIHGFRLLWNEMTQNMRAEAALNDRTLESLLVRCMGKSQVLKADMDQHHRLEPDHPDKSHSFLKRCLDRHIDRSSQRLRWQEQVQHINQLKKRGESRPERRSSVLW